MPCLDQCVTLLKIGFFYINLLSHQGIHPSQKHPLLFPSKPRLNLETVQAHPLLGNSPFYIGFLLTPSLKNYFSMNSKNNFSLLNPSYLLKVTEFLVKIFQFEFLAVIEKNIVVYQCFFSLNVPDISLFFTQKFQPSPLKKVTFLFLTNPFQKIKLLLSLPFLKGGCTLCQCSVRIVINVIAYIQATKTTFSLLYFFLFYYSISV